MSKNTKIKLAKEHNEQFKPLKGKVLGQKIAKKYKKFGLRIESLDFCKLDKSGVFIFKIRPKDMKVRDDIIRFAEDVRYSFKRPFCLFRAVKDVRGIFLIVSEVSTLKADLRDILGSYTFREEMENKNIPVVIGRDICGRVVIEDLTKMLHTLESVHIRKNMI